MVSYTILGFSVGCGVSESQDVPRWMEDGP